MSKTKLERIAEAELKIEQWKNQKAKLQREHNAQQRKARVNRLCKRSGLIEKVLPGLAELSDEQFDTFVKKTLQTGYAEKVLRGLMATTPETTQSANNNNLPAQRSKTAENKQHYPTSQTNPSPVGKPVAAAPGGSNSSLSKPE